MTTFKCTTHIRPIFNPAHFQYLQLQWNDISHLNFRLFNSTVVEFGPILAGVAGRGWWCLKTGLVSGREGGGSATRCNPTSGDLEISIQDPLFMLCMFNNFHFGREFRRSFETREDEEAGGTQIESPNGSMLPSTQDLKSKLACLTILCLLLPFLAMWGHL